MKSSFNFEKSVKSTILKVQTTKSDTSDQPVQKEHLTRFNIHLGFSKIQKQTKSRDFLNLYRKATKTKLHSLENSKDVHYHHSYTSLC